MFLCGLRLPIAMTCALLCVPAWPQAGGAPSPQMLTVGFPEASRSRIHLAEFGVAHPGVSLQELLWPRDPARAMVTPLPRTAAELPSVVYLCAGSYSEDLRNLNERGLLEPLDEVLTGWGIAPSMFLPGTREAFTVDGKLMAIPHHVSLPVLRFPVKLFGNTPPVADSWEALLDSAKPLLASRGAPGARTLLSVPLSRARFAELLALGAGATPLDLAKPDFLSSPQFEQAMQLQRKLEEEGRIVYRPASTPFHADGDALLGVDFVDCLHTDSPLGLLPLPRKIAVADAAPEVSRIPARIEGMALAAHAGIEREAALALMYFLLSPDAEWRAFEASNLRTPAKETITDMVHVPLHDSVLTSIDFEYALRKFPGLSLLRGEIARAWFPQYPMQLEEPVWQLLDERLSHIAMTEDLGKLLQELEQKVERIVRETPVDSAAYQEY